MGGEIRSGYVERRVAIPLERERNRTGRLRRDMMRLQKKYLAARGLVVK